MGWGGGSTLTVGLIVFQKYPSYPLILISHPALQPYILWQLRHHLICHYKCYDHIRHSCYKDSHVFQVFMTKIISIIQIMCSMTVKIARVSSNQQMFIFSESEGIAKRKRSHFHMLWFQWCSDRQRRRHNVTQSGSDGLSPTKPRSSREMTLPYTNTELIFGRTGCTRSGSDVKCLPVT